MRGFRLIIFSIIFYSVVLLPVYSMGGQQYVYDINVGDEWNYEEVITTNRTYFKASDKHLDRYSSETTLHSFEITSFSNINSKISKSFSVEYSTIVEYYYLPKFTCIHSTNNDVSRNRSWVAHDIRYYPHLGRFLEVDVNEDENLLIEVESLMEHPVIFDHIVPTPILVKPDWPTYNENMRDFLTSDLSNGLADLELLAEEYSFMEKDNLQDGLDVLTNTTCKWKFSVHFDSGIFRESYNFTTDELLFEEYELYQVAFAYEFTAGGKLTLRDFTRITIIDDVFNEYSYHFKLLTSDGGNIISYDLELLWLFTPIIIFLIKKKRKAR